jgi:hypothetical protein
VRLLPFLALFEYCCQTSWLSAMAISEKPEPIPVDEAVVVPEAPVEGEVEVPYSIYTSKEKWLIVAMVALAGFYRYALLPSRTKTCGIDTDVYTVHYQRTYTSRRYQPSPQPLVNPSTTLTKP